MMASGADNVGDWDIILTGESLTGFSDPIQWLNSVFRRAHEAAITIHSLDALNWSLCQFEARKAHEFETKARMLSASLPSQAEVFERTVSNQLDDLAGKYEAVLKKGGGTEEFDRIMQLERKRRMLKDSIALVKDEIDWRQKVSEMNKAMIDGSWDQAQKILELLEGLHLPHKTSQLDTLRLDLVNQIRQQS
jgi:hypothetical protein